MNVFVILEVDHCGSSPCQNNGTCVDDIADFKCECVNGWKGRYCHLQYTHCDSRTCLNGGTCVEENDSYTCKCTKDWEGSICHLGKENIKLLTFPYISGVNILPLFEPAGGRSGVSCLQSTCEFFLYNEI